MALAFAVASVVAAFPFFTPLSDNGELGGLGSATERLSDSEWIELSQIRDGDLVFRRGTGMVSRMVQANDQASPYSHVGIAVLRPGGVYVIHAAPGDPGVRLESLSVYLEESSVVEVRRVGGLSDSQEATVVAVAAEYLGRPFNGALDLGSDAEIYCTQLVWLAYLAIDIDLVPEPAVLRIPFFNEPVIVPSQLRSQETTYVFSADRPL